MGSHEIIRHHFSPTVAMYVWFLTDLSIPSDGSRAERKKIDRDHIAMAPPEVKTIKLADLISNTQSIAKYDPGFARVYMEEKRMLLANDVLGAGDRGLLRRARAIVDQWDRDHKHGRRYDWDKQIFVDEEAKV